MTPTTCDPLVLIPGMMCDARVFLPQILALSCDRAVQVSPITSEETVEGMARRVLETAPERFALAGLSLGGIVAMEILRIAPERITRVALISTSAQSERPAQAATREPLIVAAQTGRLRDALGETMLQEYLAPGEDRADILQLMTAMGMSLGADVFIRQSRALQRRPDQQKTLRMSKIPAMVLCGAHDQLTPLRRQEFIAELMPFATFKVIEDAGHLPTLEAPHATNAALKEWLNSALVLR
ncbi:alpha/beta fold hydrolase [Cochlodiniinecator piscidefendens]|uniref:alpha/beta fold hydrolase n=1 Tax=Cochlodiniinecator piscidefendens TaxID=2715756 RepID=UPI00140B5230|nr:alpha/beta hydrolase [Cochlodiniinecator piscidefendens]